MRETISEATQELIDQHRNLYHESMAAWKSSIGQVVKETVTKQTGRKDRQGNELGDEVRTERRYSSGDARHLNVALKALEQYQKIIGYQPPRADDDEEQRVAGKSFDEVIDREFAKLQAIKERQLGSRN